MTSFMDPAMTTATTAATGARVDYGTELADSEAVLDAVDRALTRLDEGVYGNCEVCGQPIGEERLAVRPTTSTCVDHPQLTD